MSAKPISVLKFTDTLTMCEMHDGFWLYDTTRGMNLSMKAKSKDAAFIEALTYYQRRLKEVEVEYRNLKEKVDNFLELFKEPEDEY